MQLWQQRITMMPLLKEVIDLVRLLYMHACMVMHGITFYWYIVFMSPETVVSAPWRQFFTTPFAKQHLVLVAVDEANCITDWLVNNYFQGSYVYKYFWFN